MLTNFEQIKTLKLVESNIKFDSWYYDIRGKTEGLGGWWDVEISNWVGYKNKDKLLSIKPFNGQYILSRFKYESKLLNYLKGEISKIEFKDTHIIEDWTPKGWVSCEDGFTVDFFVELCTELIWPQTNYQYIKSIIENLNEEYLKTGKILLKDEFNYKKITYEKYKEKLKPLIQAQKMGLL